MSLSPDDPSDELPAGAADERPPVPEGERIVGVVTDFDDVPLVGVRVEAAATGGADLDLLPTLTDGDGGFVLEGLAVGRYDLRFVLGRVKARTLAVGSGTEDLKVQLARPQGLLLVAKPAEGRSPPALLHVRLEREGVAGDVLEYEGRHLTTRLLLWSIRPGTYRVTVWGGVWIPVRADGVVVRPREPAPEVQLVLAAEGGRIHGRVVDAHGAPVPAALVAWRSLEVSGPWSIRDRALDAHEDGTFEIVGLPSGRYRVSAGRLQGPFVEADTDVVEEATSDVTLTLPT